MKNPIPIAFFECTFILPAGFHHIAQALLRVLLHNLLQLLLLGFSALTRLLGR